MCCAWLLPKFKVERGEETHASGAQYLLWEPELGHSWVSNTLAVESWRNFFPTTCNDDIILRWKEIALITLTFCFCFFQSHFASHLYMFCFTNPPRCPVYQLKKKKSSLFFFLLSSYTFILLNFCLFFLTWHWKSPVLWVSSIEGT